MSTPNESRPATRIAILRALEHAFEHVDAIPAHTGDDADHLESTLTRITDEVSPGARKQALDTLTQQAYFVSSDIAKAVARAVIQAWRWGRQPPTGELLTELALYDLRRTLLRAANQLETGDPTSRVDI